MAWANAAVEAVARSGSWRRASAGRPGAACQTGRASIPELAVEVSRGSVVRAVTSASEAGKLESAGVWQELVASTVMPWAAA